MLYCLVELKQVCAVLCLYSDCKHDYRKYITIKVSVTIAKKEGISFICSYKDWSYDKILSIAWTLMSNFYQLQNV